MQQLDLLSRVPLRDAREVGEQAAQACADKAARAGFDAEGAGRFIVSWLVRYGATSGEALVNAAIEHGFRPHDGRAFGAVMARLSRKNQIKPVGFCLRLKGHSTAGGRIWAVVK